MDIQLFKELKPAHRVSYIGSNALANYDLTTSIGPISATPGGVGHPPGEIIHTSLGNLSFTANFSHTSTGTFTATTAVPEPSSLLLFFSGTVGFIGSRWRSSRGSNKLTK